MNLGRFVNPWAWTPRGPIDRDYEPAKDEMFLKQAREEFRRWRDWRNGRAIILPGEPHEGAAVHPCTECGRECRDENVFCSEECFRIYKEKP